MSKMWSTPLRDTLPNRRNSSVPKLQCRGHRSENLYVTSPTTRDKIPGKKLQETTVILIESGAAIPAKTKKDKKWTYDPAEARNWLIGRLSEIHAGKYVGGIFDQKTIEAMMPSRTERLAVEFITSSRAERLAFWRDEYALDSFTVLQRLLAFMLSQSQQGPQMRTWLTVP